MQHRHGDDPGKDCRGVYCQIVNEIRNKESFLVALMPVQYVFAAQGTGRKAQGKYKLHHLYEAEPEHDA
jgi:hypothetical protein